MENATDIRSRRVLGFGAIFLTALISLSLVFTSGTSLKKMSIAKDDSFELNLNRSIITSDISSGKATFITARGSNIDFKFSEASQNVSGLISLSSGGFFYNDTALSGIQNIKVTLSSGSGTLSYGNAKDGLYHGSASLSGTSQITINFAKPSDYFRINAAESALSISNIVITYSCEHVADIHDDAEGFISTGNYWADGNLYHYFVTPSDSKVLDLTTDIISFDIKFISDGQLSFYLNEYYNNKFCGPFIVYSAGYVSGNGAYFLPLDDGWCRITIDLASTTKTNEPGYVSRFNISGSTAEGFVKYMGITEIDRHAGAQAFASSGTWKDGTVNYYFVEPANSKVIDVNTDIVYFDVKFKSSSGTLNFYLNQYWFGSYCGPFALSPSGVMTGTGASLTVLKDGWYRITINLASSNQYGNPEYVSKVNLLGTTADGFIKFMGYAHANAKEFEAGGAWKDGTVNHYFVEPANSKVIDSETDTIAFDIKITSETGQISFYLNEYYFGRYVGLFTVTKTGGLSGTGASLTVLEDGWYRLTIKLADTVKSSPAPSFVSRINLSASTNGDGYIKYIGVVN